MKTYIKIKNEKFIRNGNTTVCVISVVFNEKLYRMLGNEAYGKVHKKFPEAMRGSILTFTGKAKRMEGDKDNEVIARRVAQSRCKAKIYKYFKNLYTCAINAQNECNKSLENLQLACNYAQTTEEDRVVYNLQQFND
jgi:hypothetical protein